MNHHDAEIILSFADHKQAVLYFDNVIPIEYLPTQYARSLQPNTSLSDLVDSLSIDVPVELLPQQLRNSSSKELLEKEFKKVVSGVEWLCDYRMTTPEELEWAGLLVDNVVAPLKQLLENNIIKRKASIPVLLPKQYYDLINKNLSTVANASLSVATMDLVDTESLSWEHIADFKDDHESLIKLRRLRRFFSDNYSDKTRGYIEDDINLRIEDYHSACKKHGFELTTTTLGGILDSKTFLTSGVATVASVLLGEMNIASLIAAGGISIEIGKMSLKIANKQYHHNERMRKDDISYIIAAQELSKKTIS